jgi:hypothetical protein
MKEVFAPHLNRNVKFGRKRPIVRAQTLKLGNYLRAGLPSAPATSDYTANALPALRDVMGNDNLGDCVIACGGHLVGTATGNAGDLFHATLDQIIAQYSAIAGYIPGDPSTDQGTNIVDALNYWVKNGFVNGTKALGYVSVVATNVAEIQAAMWLFENLIFGVELPDSWITPFPSTDGYTWGPGTADPSNGHCYLGIGHDSKGVKIDSWGLFGTCTYDAIAELCVAGQGGGGELYAVLTPDQLTKGQTKAPNGVDWTSLIADFDSIGGTVPVPVAPPPVPIAPPSPAPIPTPPSGLTLVAAESWVKNAFNAGHPILTRGQAVSIANAALAKNWPAGS